MNNYFAHESSNIDQGCTIGTGTKIWHFSHIMPNCIIGEDCILGQNVFVASYVIIGNKVKIQNNVSLYEGVVIEDDAFLGPSVVFTNIRNPRGFIERKNEYQKTLIKKGATIGANATIICGNTIGSFAMVGAGSVVAKDVKDYALVVGNPACQIGWVSAYGHRLNFDSHNEAICPESGKKYGLEEGKVVEMSEG